MNDDDDDDDEDDEKPLTPPKKADVIFSQHRLFFPKTKTKLLALDALTIGYQLNPPQNILN